MNAKFLILTGITAVLSVSAYSNSTPKQVELSEYQIQNIEMLSLNENPNTFYGFHLIDCYDYPNGPDYPVLVGRKCKRDAPEFDCSSSSTWGKCPNSGDAY